MNKAIRNLYFDFLRGLAIVAVIGIHTVKTDFDYNSVMGFLIVEIRQIIGCAVPVFLAVSGYFLSKKNINHKTAYFCFLKRQVPTVYIPCLVWSLPWLLLSVFKGTYSFSIGLLLYFVCGLSIMYFIAVVIQCYVALPIFNKIKSWGVILCLLIGSLAALANTVYNVIPNANLPLIVCGGLLPMYGSFFVLGCWLGRKQRNYNIKSVFILYVVTLLLSITDTYYQHAYFDIPALGLKATTQINSFFAVLLLFHLKLQDNYKESVITHVFYTLGRHSFIIYLSHCVLLYFIVYRIPWLRDYWSLSWILGVFLSWMFAKALIKYIPVKYWRYVGLR